MKPTSPARIARALLLCALPAVLLTACPGDIHDPDPPSAPTVTTLEASDITATSGRIHGTINPNNGSTTWSFEFGPSSSLGGSCEGTAPLSGRETIQVICDLTGIPASMPTIFYRVVAQNSAGRSTGQILSFSTSTGGGSLLELSGITPSTLVEGQSATLTGSGFSPTPANNRVMIGGVTATVTSATATTLQITVPRACQPAGNAEVRVAVGNQQSNAVQHPFQPSSFVHLQVGEQMILRDPADFCLQFQQSSGAEAYLVGVQSVSETVTSLTPVTFSAVASTSTFGAQGARPLPPEVGVRQAASVSAPMNLRVPPVNLERRAAAEHRLREWERQHLGPRMRQARVRDLRSTADPLTLASQNLQVGQTVQVRVPNQHPGKDACRDFIPIQTTVRVIGQRGIWLEDQSNPTGGFTAADFQYMSNFFDTQIYPAITDYFGAPTDIDGNGRILMVATKEVNRIGLGGFVLAGDFFPQSECAASSVGEVFYLQVPDPQGTHGSVVPRAAMLEYTHVLIPHELVHIIQFGGRLSTPNFTTWASIWEMEGQATLAEEIMGHSQTGRSAGQNYGASVIFNDPQTSPIDWYGSMITGLFQYYGFQSPQVKAPNTPEQCSWLGRPADQPGTPCANGDNIPYGATWSFLRWLSDHHGARFPGGEKGLHQALIRNRFSGYRTIEEVIGRPMHELLAQWSAMLYVDDRVPGAAAALTLPSWNFFNLDEALVPSAQLQPRERSFSTFNDGVSVRAASTAYFRVSGAGRPGTALRARDGSGNPLPAHMQVWIVRLQ